MSKSTHKAEVVPVKLEKHPSADTLSLVRVWGYDVAVKSESWTGVDKGIFIVPDSCVDTRRPEFSFLAERANASGVARVKARKFCGVVSYGLLIPAPPEAQLGEDWAERLGVTRYEPPEPGESKQGKFSVYGEEEAGPDIETGPNKYDVEQFERYHDVFTLGEPILVFEKLDGSNARFVFWNGRYYVKTRTRWVRRVPSYSHVTVEGLTAKGVATEQAKEIIERIHSKPPQVNSFWEVLERTPALMKYLQDNPGTTVFGEIFGNTNRIKYGFPDKNRFAAFDVYRNGRFLSGEQAIAELASAGVPTAPLLRPAATPYSFEEVKAASEGLTLCEGAKPNCIREGCVIKPVSERWDKRVGRVVLKCVNPEFLSK